MNENKILYVNVENVFSTGILQSMVVRPAIEMREHYGYKVGFTSMYRDSEAGLDKIAIPDGVQTIVGKRSERGFSIENIVLHFLFLTKIVFQAKQYNILHCRSYMGTMIGLVCKKFWGVSVIFDVRGYLVDEAVESGKLALGSFKYRLLKRIEKTLFAQADVVIAVSEAMASDIRIRFSRDALIMRNPADISALGTQEKTGVEKIISYNGSLNDWHLPDLFFSTIKCLADKDKDYAFRVITSDTAKASQLANKYGLDLSRITIKRCRASQVVAELRGGGLGWCVIRPSFSKSVCWPVKFNEYLAANMPVIVNGGIGDLELLAERFDLGLVVKTSDDAEVIADQILTYAAENWPFHVSAVLAEMVSWEKQIENLHDCYQNLIAPRLLA